MRKVLIACAVAAALCASGALKDTVGNAVTAETPFGNVDGETGTVGDLVRAGGAATTNSLATVAKSGAYADLTGKPSIPSSADDVGALPIYGGTLTGDLSFSEYNGLTTWWLTIPDALDVGEGFCNIIGDTSITGAVKVVGDITAKGDVYADSVSLQKDLSASNGYFTGVKITDGDVFFGHSELLSLKRLNTRVYELPDKLAYDSLSNTLAEALSAHVQDMDNPHKVTAAQVGAYTRAQTDAKVASATNGLATSAEVTAAAGAAERAAKGYADGATNAVATALRGEIAPVRAKAESALQPAATNALASALRGEVAAATNGIPESLASHASSLSSLSSTVTAHTASKANPHGVTAAQVGAYTKAEVDAKGYVTASVTNGLLSAESDPVFGRWRNDNSVNLGAEGVAGDEAVAIGLAPFAQGLNSIAIGREASAYGNHSVAIGTKVKSRGEGSFSIYTPDPSGFYFNATYGSTARSLQSYLDEKADSSSVYSTAAADAKFYPKSEGDLWSSWWSGDDFRVTVTNYNVDVDSSTVWGRLPWARFEYKTLDTAGNTNYLRTVWDESTRWNRFLGAYAAYTNAASAAIAGAPKNWGAYTPTGFDSPVGYTWLDTPAVVVSGGLAYQKTVTSEGAIWVLCSNGMQLETGGSDTNGFFRIADDEGNSVFEVVKGDKRVVGATAGSVHTWEDGGITHLRVVYNIESSSPPALQVSRTLDGGGTWYAETDAANPANFAGWTGASGAWTNAVWGKASEPSLFVKATYEVGGDTYIRNAAPVSMQYIMLNGKKYSLGTATVSGNTVLTLTEAE